MSDGVAITPGAGATVATDDAGAAGHVQIVKMAVSADGSATPIPADADGLLVNLGANNDVTVNGVATEAKQDTANTALAALAGAVSGAEVQVDVLTLPSGLATDAALAAILTELQGKLEAGEAVELGATTLAALESITAAISGTVAVSAAALPLPAGAATETTVGTRLSESDFDAKAGSLTETAPASDTASSGLNGRLQRIAQRLTSLIAQLPAALGAGGGLKVDGSGTALPVSGTFWQATQPVSGTVTANAGTGTQAVSLATAPALVAGTANIGDVDIVGGTIVADAVDSTNPVPVGGRASTAIPTAMSADGDRVKAWFDVFGAYMTRTRPAATATLANVVGSATSVTLFALNTGRLGAKLYNDSTATLYLKFGSTASTTSFTELVPPGAPWKLDVDAALYTGVITGIWSSATGSARCTELTS